MHVEETQLNDSFTVRLNIFNPATIILLRPHLKHVAVVRHDVKRPFAIEACLELAELVVVALTDTKKTGINNKMPVSKK
jgi:hypothetical protein